MDIFMPMSTTRRHNKILNEFLLRMESLNKLDTKDIFSSDCSLAYWGSKKIANDICELVDINKIDDLEYFKKEL